MSLPRVSDEAGKVALGIVALVEVPQIWSQWQPSVSTLRGGDWPGMVESVHYAHALAWAYSLALAALISWIIGAWWPLVGAVVMNLASMTAYEYFVMNPADGNDRDF